MALKPGDLVDQKYRILRLLGEGGMGAVYEGENTRIHRRVAIKVLHASVAQSEDAVARFEREAQAAGRIGSEHIVEVLDLGHLPDGDRYMVMEFLEGQALSDRIHLVGRLPPQTIAPIAIELLEGLSAAHDAGIIHRDLKPDNVYLLANRSGHKDFVKILDFGISKFSTLSSEFSMTRTGAVMGTPYYMSPEQAKGARVVDPRADIYAVGVILYEATAGEVPFSAETFNELLFKIVLENAVPLVQKVPGLDPAFAAIVEKAMARDPAQRYESARHMQGALKSWFSAAPRIAESTLSQGTPAALDQTQLGGPAAGAMNQPGQAEGRVARAEAAPQAEAVQKTQGAWAASSGSLAAGRKKARWPLWAGVALGAVVLSGGAYVVSASLSQEKEEARVAAERAEEEQAELARRAEELRLEAERARAEAERSKAEMERLAAEASKAEMERLENERRAADAAAREAEEAAQKAARSAASRPRPAPAAAPAPAPAPTPRRAEPTAPAGRVIRTDL